jgi:general secretion pathway protein H
MISPSKPDSGFTLLEMLVVLAILGAVLAVTVGAMPRRGGTLDLTNAADGVAGTLRLGRARAIASGRPVVFTPSQGGRGYALDGQQHVLPPAVTLAMTGPAAISFNPDGGASGGAVRVASAVRAMLVRVDWLTGRVLITEAR